MTNLEPQISPTQAEFRALSLARLLEQFEPTVHGGEVMAWPPIGLEVHAPPLLPLLAQDIAP